MQSQYFAEKLFKAPGFSKPQIVFKTENFLLLAVAVLVFPLRWILAWVLAVGFHEICHYLSISAFGIPIRKITIGAGGAVIQTGAISGMQELICALAGPFGGLLLLAFRQWLPYVAICALLQSTFNLIPIFPLDGGRALRCILGLIIPISFYKAQIIIESLVLTAFLGMGFYATFFLCLGPIPLIITVFLFIKAMILKIPCKQTQLRVQ